MAVPRPASIYIECSNKLIVDQFYLCLFVVEQKQRMPAVFLYRLIS